MPRDLPMYASFPQAYVWLRPPVELAEALDAHRKHWWWPDDCEFPHASRLHLTLHPLGPLDDAELDQVLNAMSALRVHAFDLDLVWSGVWTRNAIAVVRPREHDGLTRLHAELSRCLHGSDPVRGWSPHVTLARKVPRAGADLLPALRWPVREFFLVRSWLRPHRVRHEVLRRYELV